MHTPKSITYATKYKLPPTEKKNKKKVMNGHNENTKPKRKKIAGSLSSKRAASLRG